MASLEFGPLALTAHEVVALRDGQFEANCPRMRLEQSVFKTPKVFSGPGIIRQTAENRLRFTLFAGERLLPEEVLTRMSSVPSGEIIPESEYYILYATDAHQRQWMSRNILPNLNLVDEKVTFCTGDFVEMRHENELRKPFKKDILFIRVFEDVDLPFNATTEITTSIAGRKSSSDSLNVLHFTAGDYEFCMHNESNSLLVTVWSGETRFPVDVETRIIEALQFVLARPVSWSVVTKYAGATQSVYIRLSRSGNSRPRIQPPITIELHNDKPFCTLFERYLEYILPHSGRNLHPISAQMRAICRASASSVNTEALVLSVAVEIILKYIDIQESKLSDDEKEWVKKIRKYVDACGAPERLCQRVGGLLGMLHEPSAADRLNALIDQDVITNDQKKAWQSLRHRTAHSSDLFDSLSVQEVILLCDTILVLFYHLVFYAIGYQGSYTDYSTIGWPSAEYTLTGKSTEEAE
jgi:hypothetical protein